RLQGFYRRVAKGRGFQFDNRDRLSLVLSGWCCFEVMFWMISAHGDLLSNGAGDSDFSLSIAQETLKRWHW
ncbi:unnamed protein product, partial [Dovyalis caffra]